MWRHDFVATFATEIFAQPCVCKYAAVELNELPGGIEYIIYYRHLWNEIFTWIFPENKITKSLFRPLTLFRHKINLDLPTDVFAHAGQITGLARILFWAEEEGEESVCPSSFGRFAQLLRGVAR